MLSMKFLPDCWWFFWDEWLSCGGSAETSESLRPEKAKPARSTKQLAFAGFHASLILLFLRKPRSPWLSCGFLKFHFFNKVTRKRYKDSVDSGAIGSAPATPLSAFTRRPSQVYDRRRSNTS